MTKIEELLIDLIGTTKPEVLSETITLNQLFNNPIYKQLCTLHDDKGYLFLKRLMKDIGLTLTWSDEKGKLLIINKRLLKYQTEINQLIIKANERALVRSDLADIPAYTDILVVKMVKNSHHPEIYSETHGRVRVQPSLYKDWLLCPGLAIYRKLDVKVERKSVRGNLYYQSLKPLTANHPTWGHLSNYVLPKVKLSTETGNSFTS